MAHYDDDTQKFIEDVSKGALGVARDISKKRLPGSLTKKLVGKATHHLMEKESATKLNALHVFEELQSKYGTDWQDWEPETLEESGAFDINPDRRNMILALQVICKTNFPFESWATFERVSHALNGNAVHFNEIIPAELDEAAWTIKVLQTIRPSEHFALDVCNYMAACAQHSGVLSLPANLFPEDAQKALGEISGFVQVDDEITKVQKAKTREIEEYVKARAA